MACVFDPLVQSSSSLPDATTSCLRGIDASLFDNLKLAPLYKTRSDKIVVIDDGSSNGSTQNSSMYMLVSLNDDAGFILYRIDPLSHLDDNDCHLNDLCPLLVFPNTCLRMDTEYFSCIKFGSKLYFFGLDYYQGSLGIHSKSTNVYTIEEDVLMSIKPSEDNDVNNFKQHFTKTRNPMYGPKFVPVVFVANEKLYVLSKFYTKTLFEVFSPVDQTWQVLPTPTDRPFGSGLSFVSEQNQKFYYIVSDALLSFNLETHEWTIPPGYFYHGCYSDIDDPRPPPPFLDKCVSFIGDLAFGYVYDHDAKSYNVSASRSCSGDEEFMKINLAPDQDFLQVLRSSRFTYMSDHYKLYSDYIVALQDLDSRQVLCIVTYGTKLPDEDGDSVYTKTSYVSLSFFDIPGDHYTSEERPVQECDVYAPYADVKNTEDGGVVRRCFNANFRHTAHFIVKNSHLCTQGQLKACFF